MLHEDQDDKPKNTTSVSKNVDGISFYRKPKIINEKKADVFTTRSPAHGYRKEKRHFPIVSPFVIFLFIIFLLSILPIKIIDTLYILRSKASNNLERFEDVYSAIKNNDYQKAKNGLTMIQEDTEYIKKKLDKIGQENVFLSRFLPLKDSTINNENILSAVSSLAKIGSSLIDNVVSLENLQIEDINNSENNKTFFENIKSTNQNLKSLEPDFVNLKDSLDVINLEQLNKDEKKYLGMLKGKIDQIDKYYYLLIEVSEQIPILLGQNFDKKYLIVFQNNTELRPSGGFIGSYGILTIRDAKIKKLFIDSIYNPDGQISRKITPPAPLQKVTPSLAMRDAGWDPNFPDSAKSLVSLYEIEGGFTPDGVIALDTAPLIDFLDLVGPIKLEEYNVEINKENFIYETQYKTGIDYNPDDQNPKKFLGDLAPILLEKIFSYPNQGEIFKILIKNVEEKHIQFFSPNEKTQDALSKLGATGEIKNIDGDYFSYINANIGGMKTNSEIEESLNHYINIDQEGKIIHKVQLRREHNGSYNWPSGINYSYVRFYLPLGSKILEIKNFEKGDSIRKDSSSNMLYLEEGAEKAQINDLDISTEDNKTVVGIWQAIKPGQNIASEISYELPAKINPLKTDKYNLLIQKQAGVVNQKISVQINAPGKTTIEPIITVNGSAKKNNFKDSFDLRSDKQIEIALKK